MIRIYLFDKRTGSTILADFISDPAKPGAGEWHFAEKEYGGVRWYPLASTPDLINMAEAELQKRRGIVALNPGGEPNPENESMPFSQVAA